MKQTSSALTFLMAQYRAIFKRAYVKGIAAAVLLTAGLAAGQAQAAISGNLGSGASTINAETGVVTVNAGNIVASGADNTLSGTKTNKYVNDITVEAGGSLTISGTILQGGVLTANSGSTLNISGDIVGDSVDGQGGGDASEWTASFKADSATVNVSGTVQTGAIQLDNTKLTIGKSSGVSAHNQGAYVIGGFGDGDKNVIAATNSVITFQDYGFLQSNDRLIVQDSTLNFNGAKPKSNEETTVTLTTEVENFETAFIRGRDGVELTNTKIVVGDSKKGGIYGPTTSLNGGSIKVGSSGEFVFDGDWNGFNNPTNGKDTYSHASGTISLTDVDITNSGTLTIGGSDHLADLTLTGGSMENTGTVNIYTDKISVSEDYFNGLFADENSKVTFGGSAINVDGEVDLNELRIIGANDALSVDKLTISKSSATLAAGTINLDKAYKADKLVLDAGTLNIDASSEENKRFTFYSGTITVHDELNGSSADQVLRIHASADQSNATLKLEAGANGGELNNIDRINVGLGNSKGKSNLNVTGKWNFNNARISVSSGGEATIDGNVSSVDELMLDNNAQVTVNGALTIDRLLGSQASGGNSTIAINGTLTVEGDDQLSDEGKTDGDNKYANDVQLTQTSVTINNGGTLAITKEDALDDFINVTSGATAADTTVSVVTSGSNSGKFGGWNKEKVDLLAGGTLQLNLGELNINSLTSDKLSALKTALVKDPTKGSFDFGKIDIALSADLEKEIASGNGSVSYDTLASGGVNNVQGIDKLEGLTVAVDTSKNSSINLSMGASSVALTGSDKVNVEGSLILASNSADGDHQFVYQAATTPSGSATVADVSVAENSGVNLTGAGTIGSLTKTGSATGTSAVLNAGEGATQTVAGEIDLDKVTIGTGTVTVAEDITATELTLTGDLVNTAESGANTLTAAKLTQAQGTTLTADELTLGSTTGSGTESLVQGNIVAYTITLEQAANSESNTLTIAGGSTVTSNTFEAAEDTKVYVGTDGDNSSAGSLSVTTMDLNGADLIVDPEFGTKASFVGVKGFNDRKNTYEAGMLDGNAYALKNAILAIGDENEANVRALFADYLDEHNSLSASGVGAIVYVAKNMGVADTHKIVVDPAAKLDDNGKLDTTEYTADLTIRNGGALAIDVTAAAKNDGTAALNFEKKGAKIEAGTSAKILLTGDYTQYDTLTLFKDGASDSLTFTPDSAQSITVETLNGLLQGTYSGGSTFDVDSMTLQTERVKTAYTDTSAAVRHSIIAYLAKDANWDERDSKGYKKAPTHGALIGDVVYNPNANNANADGYLYADGSALETTVKTDNWMFLDNPAYDAKDPDSKEPQYLVYLKPQNAFLDAVAHDTLSGNAADSAAHMAEFGGVAQVALKAGAATTDAIAGRMGMGAQNSAITFANNGQGAGIWVTPIYVSSDSDGFEAQGVDYGTDINLYGVALGGDYTLANGVRIGAMFNVGSGDADGQGAGSSVTSDFDYYGFGLYAGYSVGQFSIVGDVSYTAVDNDVEANTGIDKLETSLDSANLSVGVTGSYAFETAAGVTVTPHVGLRYSNIDIDDYSVKGKTYGTVGDYSADSLSVFSIPVGVTIASEFQAGTWSVKPSFDVTLTGNFGDDEAEGTFHWAGVENIDSSLNSEIFDNFTYGVSLGIAAQSSSGISLGVAVGYTGSSNVDDFGVNANARFTF